MEFGFLMLVAVGGVLGLALRCGLFGALTGGLVAAVALGAAGLLLPFVVVVRWGRL